MPRRRDLLLLFAVGLVLRVGAWALLHESPAVAESSVLSNRAILGDRAAPVPPDEQRAPGVIWMYNGVAAVFGRDRSILRAANAVLGSLLAPLFLAWAARRTDHRTARLAALLLAIHPELVFFSVTLWSEALYMVLLLAALVVFGGARRGSGLARTAAAGILLGLAGLTRETGLILAALLSAWLLAEARPGRWRPVACAALLAGSCALVVLPWSLSMTRRSGHPVLVTDLNAMRFYVGNGRMPAGAGEYPGRRIGTLGEAYRNLGDTQAARKAAAWREGAAAVRDELPAWPVRKLVRGLRQTLGLNSFPAARLLAHPEDGGWAGSWAFHFTTEAFDRRAAGRLLASVTVAFHALVLLAGAGGIALGALRGSGGISLALVAAHLLPPIVTLACSRYRIPILPLLAWGTAAILVSGGSLWAAASPRRRVLAVLAVAAAAGILALSGPYLLPPQYG